MQPLTLDDLLPLNEYAGRRHEFFDSLSRYLDRYRRVRIGPLLTLFFENRQTLWFRVQEILRITRLSDPQRVGQELDLYNRLLPRRNHLHASLVIATPDESTLSQPPDLWQSLHGQALTICIGHMRRPALLITNRPEDLAIGTAHWVHFKLEAEDRRTLANFGIPAHFEVAHRDYQHASQPLGEEVRQSLLEDLALSDRDEIAA